MGRWTKQDASKGSSSKTLTPMTYQKGPMSGKQRSFQAMGNSSIRFPPTPWWKIKVLTGNWRCCGGPTAGQLWSILGGTQSSKPVDSSDESHTMAEIRTTHFDVYYGCFVENSLLSLRKIMRLGHYFHTNVLPKGLGQMFFERSM